MMIDAEDLVIRKTIHVAAPLERAFEVFTTDWAAWWPTATHSVAQGETTADWRLGGLVLETKGDERHEWADVLELDPPHSLRLRWRVNPGKPPTEVSVSFVAEGDGTRVDLVHSGWEAFADRADEEFQGYTSGWGVVLAAYLAYADS
jgi:uncharacterized protein YndB with AHSA1/START domain